MIGLRRAYRSSRNSPLAISWRTSRWVEAINRRSICLVCVDPNRRVSPCCTTRNSRVWAWSGSSLMASRNKVPPSAASISPVRACLVLDEPPDSWPNSSASINRSGIAEQFKAMMGAFRRELRACTARATNSLPVPDSPRTSTVESTAATLWICANNARIALLWPIMPSMGESKTLLRFVVGWRCSSSTRSTHATSSTAAKGRTRKSAAPRFIASTMQRGDA